jgi:hypothetical protein
MRERKQGTLRSGRSGKKVTSRKQAIAIGLAEARREGGKVPRKPAANRKRRTTSGGGKTVKRSTASRARATKSRRTTRSGTARKKRS